LKKAAQADIIHAGDEQQVGIVGINRTDVGEGFGHAEVPFRKIFPVITISVSA